MCSLDADRSTIDALALQTGFTDDAVASMMRSVAAGHGRMAQFDHREFGGPGQWMQGGMLMISDFTNRDLHRRVAHLCEAIAQRFPAGRRTTPGDTHQRQSRSKDHDLHGEDARPHRPWWPASFGSPAATGAQNDLRYAWFSDARRLAIDEDGVIRLYDTGDHRITGVSQRQGPERTFAFTSQHGLVDLATLAAGDAMPTEGMPDSKARVPRDESTRTRDAPDASPDDPVHVIEKLAALHVRGILSDDEFTQKKAELLARM